MSFEWPIDKLGLINSALSQTGDNQINAANDGSDEWNTCSPAYERGLAYVTEAHPWNWVTAYRTLTPSPTPPTDDQWDTAFVLPNDLVHLISARVNDRNCIWDFLNGQLVTNAQGGPPAPATPVAPDPVTIKGIFSTNSDIQNGTPTVVLALQHFVMSGIYRGLHEDAGEAAHMLNAARALLEEAKARHDMQKPKRAMFNSRLTMSRRVRRPWFPMPPGWGGLGGPGNG
jgi:hypothetical protein